MCPPWVNVTRYADQEREGQGSMTAAYELHELALKHIREEDSIQQARFRLAEWAAYEGRPGRR